MNINNKTFCVTLSVTGYYTVHINAADAEAAIHLAREIFESDPNPKIENTETTVWEITEEE